jgi:hypothetical protein
LGESDEEPFRPADGAEPIRVFIPDYLAHEPRAALAKPLERLIDVVNSEHDAQAAESVHSVTPESRVEIIGSCDDSSGRGRAESNPNTEK